jgi:glycosyltransferase involved in cell wall biosynthesis
MPSRDRDRHRAGARVRRMTGAVARRAPVALVAGCGFPVPRGSQVLIDQMAHAFLAAGLEPHLVAPMARGFRRPYPTQAVAPRSGLMPPADPVGWPAIVRPLFDGALAAQLDRFVRREHPAVLHAHNYEGLAAALIVRRLRRVPVVFHSHAVLADELPQYAPSRGPWRRLARRLGAWCDRTLPRLADQVVVLSDDVARYLRGCGVRAERLSVVPPGLAPEALVATRRPSPHVIFAGNLDPYQGIDLLLDAWTQARLPAAVGLSFVTHAPARGLAAEIARRRLGGAVRIVRACSVAEVAAELATGAVGVSPRRSWSGFPIKTLNYMASSLATIALAPSAKGVVSGETGWVVEDDGASALAETLRAALGDLTECVRRGRAARMALAEGHAWAQLAPVLVDVSRRAADRAC